MRTVDLSGMRMVVVMAAVLVFLSVWVEVASGNLLAAIFLGAYGSLVTAVLIAAYRFVNREGHRL